jgi:hypothetical protein
MTSDMQIAGVVIPIPASLVVPLLVVSAVIFVLSTIYDLAIARPRKRRARKLRAQALFDPTPALPSDNTSFGGCSLGHPMPPSAKFCSKCGGTRPLDSVPLISPNSSVDYHKAVNEVPNSSPSPSLLKSSLSPSGVKPMSSGFERERKSACLNGHPIQTGQRYCTTCGASI